MRRFEEGEKYFIESKELLEKLLSKQPRDIDVLWAMGALSCNLGLTYANLGRTEDAMASADRAISIFSQLTA